MRRDLKLEKNDKQRGKNIKKRQKDEPRGALWGSLSSCLLGMD